MSGAIGILIIALNVRWEYFEIAVFAYRRKLRTHICITISFTLVTHVSKREDLPQRPKQLHTTEFTRSYLSDIYENR